MRGGSAKGCRSGLRKGVEPATWRSHLSRCPHGCRGRWIAVAVIARNHHARAATICHDAVVVNRVRRLQAGGSARRCRTCEPPIRLISTPWVSTSTRPGLVVGADIGAGSGQEPRRDRFAALVFDVAGAVEDGAALLLRFHAALSIATGPLIAGSGDTGLITAPVLQPPERSLCGSVRAPVRRARTPSAGNLQRRHRRG